MVTILDHVATIDFAPGSNLKGHGIGANTVYFLPQLELERLVCVGSPSKSLIVNLQSLSPELILSQSVENVEGSFVVLPLEDIPDLSVDCVYICDNKAITAEELERILKPNGIVYYEYYGRDRTQFSSLGNNACHYWLTPTFGAAETAVPLGHTQSAKFLENKRLYTSSIRQRTFELLRKRLTRTAYPKSANKPAKLTGNSTTKKKNKSKLRHLLRFVRSSIIRLGASLEYVMIHQLPTSRLLQRYGVVMRKNASMSCQAPDYLQNIAAENHLDISTWEWAFLAKGDYPSQKILFYLIPEKHQTPTVIVKMVRESKYNKHLQREADGLKHLQNSKFNHLDTIPEVLFYGYHNNLIIVGETVLDGKPFAERTQFDANCPYAEFIVQWLIDLGMATLAKVETQQVTNILQTLYNRFLELYEPNASQEKFLSEHLDHLRELDQLPLVFSHGDPGLHNCLIKQDDKVAVLDWENAEIHGLPLWDLFYFLTDFCVKAGIRDSTYSHLSAYQHFFLNESSLQPFVVEAVKRYCKTIGIDSEFIIPLYYLFLMYRCLKQSVLLVPEQLKDASNWRLLQLTIDHQDAALFRAFAQL